MADRTPLERLKYAVKKVSDKCSDQGAWDKWARRLLMGIDNSVEAATKCLNKNEAKYVAKFPPEPEKRYDDYDKMDEDAGYSSGVNLYGTTTTSNSSSSYNSSVSFSSSDPDDEEDGKPTKQQQKNQFVARSAACKAVIAWGEWTMTKEDDPAKGDLQNEMEIELSVVDSALSDL